MARSEPKDGNELIDEIAEVGNIDFFFDRNPKTLTDEQLRDLIEIERSNRARAIEKKG